MRLYLDASAIIYSIEGADEVRKAVLARTGIAVASPEGGLFTSRLSVRECRVRPMREGRSQLLATYDEMFAAEEWSLRK